MDNTMATAMAAKAVASAAAAAVTARAIASGEMSIGRRRFVGPTARHNLPPGSDTPPNQTLYCNNLNDRVSLNDLLSNLFEYFSPYGEVIDIVAQKSDRKRGQAFIVFSEMHSAAAALRSLQGKHFLGKAMRINFAKSKSDAILKMEGVFKPRKPGVERQKSGGASGNSTSGEKTGSSSSGVNRVTLFVEDLPKEVNKKALDILFSQYAGHTESRLIEGRGVAFVDFSSKPYAEVAMTGLQGFKASPDRPIRISLAHQ